MASRIYNTITNAYLGPNTDGTYLEAEQRRVVDALCTQLLFYDRITCLTDDLSLVPLLVDIVGLEYTIELLGSGQFGLIRSPANIGLGTDGCLLWITSKGRGKARFGKYDWPKAAVASPLDEAAAWVVRGSMPHLDEPQVRQLKDAVMQSTIELPPERALAPVFDRLDETIRAVNDRIVETGHWKTEVVRVDRRGGAYYLTIVPREADKPSIEQAVLSYLELRREIILPSLLEGSALKPAHDIAVPQRSAEPSRGCFTDESVSPLRQIIHALCIPSVGDLLREGRIVPRQLVDLRECQAGRNLRQWYAQDAASGPSEAAAAAMELVKARAGGSVPSRVVNFLLGPALAAGGGALLAGVGPLGSLGVGSLVAMLQACLGARVAKLLCDRNHPMVIVEKLRDAGGGGDGT